jgi:hypothetical protein
LRIAIVVGEVRDPETKKEISLFLFSSFPKWYQPFSRYDRILLAENRRSLPFPEYATDMQSIGTDDWKTDAGKNGNAMHNGRGA